MNPPFKARVLYAFEGERGTNELSVTEGETLTITNLNVGEGWWEATNSHGVTGLVPETYVERMGQQSPPPPSMPPPSMPPTQYSNVPDSDSDFDDDDWGDSNNGQNMYESVKKTTNASYYSNETVGGNANYEHRNSVYSKSYEADDNRSESNFNSNQGTLAKKPINKFNIYSKPLENYLLGNTPADVNFYYTVLRDERCLAWWQPQPNPYTVQINSPKKNKKMAGLKSFIAYQLTPSFSQIEVSRRYKHFDWLHDRLSEKFSVIAVPPLPDKQISGRYEEQFIEHRRLQLQEFINYMCRHPVLANCTVWKHFLSCSDEREWKKGKREAEKDVLVGANFCNSIEPPSKELMASELTRIDEHSKYIVVLDQNIKKLIATCTDQQQKCVNMFKREFHKVGDSFFALGSCWDFDSKMPSGAAREIQLLTTAYMNIGKLFEEQAKDHWKTLYDKLYLYKGITANIPDILSLQKSSETKRREYERTMNDQQLIAMRKRADTLTYAVFAELNHFHEEKNTDLRLAMKTFLQSQLNFYTNIVQQLQGTLEKFE